MSAKLAGICGIALAAMVCAARADVLELKNGKVLTGSYVGGTAATIRFQTSEGVQVVETSQALALTFTGQGSSATTPAPATAAPAPAAIGAISDEEHGAAKGAAIGAVASGVKKGPPVVVSPGTLVEFQLQQPVTLTSANERFNLKPGTEV